MLRWAFSFFVLALIAALFGYGGLVNSSAPIARTLFFVFFAVFLVTFVAGLAVGRRSTA
jgi:uncharacterized membrane protein YtjA (UPF0391 family)